MTLRNFSNGGKYEFRIRNVGLGSSSEPCTIAPTGEGSIVAIQTSIGESIRLARCWREAGCYVKQLRRLHFACDLVGHGVGSSSRKTSESVEEVGALAAHDIKELEQPICTIRDMHVRKRSEEVGVIVDDELRRYSKQNMHRCVVHPQVVKIRISS